MIAQIKKWGGSYIIVLDPKFMNFYNLEENDWLDISDIVKITKVNKEMNVKK